MPSFFKKRIDKGKEYYLGRGLYLAYYLHTGVNSQSRSFIFSITEYSAIEDKYIKCINLLDANHITSLLTLEYNPKTAMVRLSPEDSSSYCEYIFCKLT